jgi:hypothetical protein
METACGGSVVRHELKSWPEFFQPVMRGEKTAELRLNDRNYQVGDILLLQEWEPEIWGGEGKYTGRQCERVITHVLDGVGSVGAIAPLKGLDRKYVILSIRNIFDASGVTWTA